MSSVRINQQHKRVEIASIYTDNTLVYEYFNGLADADREAALSRALYIGVLALQEDRLSAFLAKTKNELGTELESLKVRFDIEEKKFFGSSQKGVAAEQDIAAYLEEFCNDRSFKDDIDLTGNASGLIPKNKTGDICCTLAAEGDMRIVVECKFDKGVGLGAIEDRDIYGNRSDTAWSQLIEASANRDGKVSIIVFDRELVNAGILKTVENVGYIPSIGFIAIVDTRRGDYSNLGIAYGLARDICMAPTSGELDRRLLSLVIRRVLADIEDVLGIEKYVKTAAQQLTAILEGTHKSRLSMKLSQKMLERLLERGTLTSEDMLSLYLGNEPKQEYEAIKHELLASLLSPASEDGPRITTF